MLTEQAAFGTRDAPQVVAVWTNPVPVSPSFVIDICAVPVLVSVTVCAVLVVPTVTLPKATGFGAPLRPGVPAVAATPVPVRATWAGEPAASEVISRLAELAPATGGAGVDALGFAM
jgi:hypothetical protein